MEKIAAINIGVYKRNISLSSLLVAHSNTSHTLTHILSGDSAIASVANDPATKRRKAMRVSSNRELNCAVLHIATRLFPRGFDLSLDAPATLEELTAHIASGKRMMVWSGHTRSTLFPDLEFLYAFRAWHQYCHWKGGNPMTAEGERGALALHATHLHTLYGSTTQVNEWIALIRTEIMESVTQAPSVFHYHGPKVHELRV